MRVHAARASEITLVYVQAQFLAVSLVARLALAQEMCGQIAAFGIVYAPSGNRGICALVNIWKWRRRVNEMHIRIIFEDRQMHNKAEGALKKLYGKVVAIISSELIFCPFVQHIVVVRGVVIFMGRTVIKSATS